MPLTGVSVVVPVHNGAPWIRDAVSAVLADAGERPLEVILVDDGSTDGSGAILQELSADGRVRIVAGRGRGAAAALNAGIAAAAHDVVCQVDQDVIVQRGWMQRLVAALDDPGVGAAQGYYISAPDASLVARAMNLDLEQRYAGISGADTDHVCTGNTAYRASALARVGGFDESLGYGYDNDVSYRLKDAGYRLLIARSAGAVHRWRDGVAAYLVQQYGFGYGRIDLVAKFPRRAGGDAVSPLAMMLHPMAMALAVAGVAFAGLAAALGWPWRGLAVGSAALAAMLVVERGVAGIAAARRFGDGAALLFPVLHLARDLAWVAAMGAWLARRALRRPFRPSHSMGPRRDYGTGPRHPDPAPKRPIA